MRSPWLGLGILTGLLITGGIIWLIDVASGDRIPEVAQAPPGYVEEVGPGHVYAGEFQFFVGGGVAVLDCNDDGFPDLYFAGGTEPAGLYLNRSSTGGDLRFEPAHDLELALTNVTGAYPLDVDSDGLEDLVVLRVGENVLFRGVGDCAFERANELWGIDGGQEWTVSFSAKWDGDQTLPTLAFGNYLALDRDGGAQDKCEDHSVFQPGDDYYDEITLSPGWCTLSILFSDWSRSGLRDLRMTNDRHYYRDGEEQLWRVQSEEPPSLYTAEDGWQQLRIWGMGIASQDLTGDGLPEVFLTSQGDNKLQTLDPDMKGPNYRDIALPVGVTAHRPFSGDSVRPSTAWHAEFGDVNNDGFVDLFVTKGNVDAMPEFAMEDPNNLLMNEGNGTFTEGAAEAGLIDVERSRGGAVVDLNLDGLLDIVVVERRVSARVWKNTGNEVMSHWLGVRLRQPGPNRDAVGSWIEVRAGGRIMQQELVVGGGHAGGQIGWIHFGLGDFETAELRVTWPDGSVGPWTTVSADGFVIVQPGESGPAIWEPLR